MLDRYFWGMATRLSPEAPVPIVQVVQVSATLGGAGNVAVNLVGLNHEVVLIGACGKDPAGDALTQIMREYGITEYLVTERDSQTTTKTRVIADRQQVTRIDEEKIKELFNKGKADIRNYIKKVLPRIKRGSAGCKAIIVSDYAKGVVDEMLVKDILELSEDVFIFVDPKGMQWEKYRGAFCVTPNLGEFMAYWHSQPRDKAIDSETQLRNAVREVVIELDLEYMVVTRGGGGILVIPKEGQMHQLDVEKRGEVVDVTGAGDTVVASLASQIVRGTRMEDCAEFANKMAGIVVSRLGTSPITREDTK
jgi:D-beta-D-heptose 7-phosphate kinase/D-beta-D-heptose 1-phosphate adenosyltransferase